MLILINEDIQLENFGKRLKKLRESKGMSIRHLARLLNLTPSTYLFYEQGKSEPKLKNLKNLSEVLNVSIDYLVKNKTSEQEEFKRIVSKWAMCNYKVEEKGNKVIITPLDKSNEKSSLSIEKKEFIRLTQEIEENSKEIELINFKLLTNRVTNEKVSHIVPHTLFKKISPIIL